MPKDTKKTSSITFWLELILASVIPFIILWSTTPTNVLNSSSLWMSLESFGLYGATAIFFAGIPFGIKGIKESKNLGKLRIPTLVLSILNLTAGIIEVAIMILLLVAAARGFYS